MNIREQNATHTATELKSRAGERGRTYRQVIAGLALTTLLGCGSMPGERALSGAGIGAGTGAAIGAVTGLGVGTGAAVGAAVGAAAGGLTKQRHIDLGQPAWKR